VSELLDRFEEHYYRWRPVNATFTGVHAYNGLLPNWSEGGLIALDAEMHMLRAEIVTQYPAAMGGDVSALRDISDADRSDAIDARLASAFLEIQIAENASRHGPRGNPALWTGEAVFSIISLMIRECGTHEQRTRWIAQRLALIPQFLSDATNVLAHAPIPTEWVAKSRRDCEGAAVLLTTGLNAWLGHAGLAEQKHADAAASDAVTAQAKLAAKAAVDAFDRFARWLDGRTPNAAANVSCGDAMYDLLLSRGHECAQPRAALLAEARASFTHAKHALHEKARDVAGSWELAQSMMAADHPASDQYLQAFADTWTRCHDHAVSHDVVTWPDWPLRYAPFPKFTRDAAPFLYYLFYRAPSAFDAYTTYDYVVPPLPPEADSAERHLRVWNHTAITLNHVVHHGAIGHHVQNWHAYHRATSRVGRIAAVDCANRIGMFCGGSMAEGWACYATALMDELDFLTPIQSVSEHHSHLRFLARAIVDIELHQGTMSTHDAERFYVDEVGMAPEVARAEVVKNGMFPCTAIMYWLGTRELFALRERKRAEMGESFSLKQFHDTVLSFGSIPVALVSRLMTPTVQ